MIKVADIVYHCHHEFNQPAEVLEKHRPTLGFTDFIKDRINYTVVRHLNHRGTALTDGVRYAYFKRSNAPWQIPIATHRYIQLLNPDIVLVHGFIFPLQVMALKTVLPKKCAVILQHHADQPAHSIRTVLQKMADRYVDAYMFTAASIARPWIDQKIISSENKIAAVPGASASVQKKDKTACKKKLAMTGSSNFLWVGRLNDNKDPLTVLKAFAQYIVVNPAARLFMIYQTDELIMPVKELLSVNEQLQCRVQLIGKLAAASLADWYNAADFFITGSHAEAAGYALLEAMSVGCIPVVTNIPSFQKIVNNGGIGFLYTPGNSQELANLLAGLTTAAVDCLSAQTAAYYDKNLGYRSVADGLYNFFIQLHAIKR